MEFYRWLFILCERGNLWENQKSLFPWKCWNDIHRRWEFTICHDHRDDHCNNMWWITDLRWWGKSIRIRGWRIWSQDDMNIMASRFQKDYLWRFHFKAVCFDFICLSCNNMWCISDFRWQGKSIRIRWLGICSQAINRISMISTCHSGDIAGYNGIEEGMTYSLFSNHFSDFHSAQNFSDMSPKILPGSKCLGWQGCRFGIILVINE